MFGDRNVRAGSPGQVVRPFQSTSDVIAEYDWVGDWVDMGERAMIAYLGNHRRFQQWLHDNDRWA